MDTQDRVPGLGEPLSDAARRLFIREALEDKGNVWSQTDPSIGRNATKLASLTKMEAVYDLWVVDGMVVVFCDQRWVNGTQWWLVLPEWASYCIDIVAHVLVDFVASHFVRFSPGGDRPEDD